jgi:hypothetical protein
MYGKDVGMPYSVVIGRNIDEPQVSEGSVRLIRFGSPPRREGHIVGAESRTKGE